MTFRVLLLFSALFLIQAQLQPRELQDEIRNTVELIQLHHKKLQLLQELHRQRFPHLSLPDYSQNSVYNSTVQKISRLHPKLLILAKYQNKTRLFPPNYILIGNHIMKISKGQQITDFIGQVLIIEQNKLTTIIGGKISISELKHDKGVVSKEQYFLGLDAEPSRSLWHRNLNIKDAEDLLVQWKQNIIVFRGKEVRELKLQDNQTILALHSLNQYKLAFISNLRVGTVNSRSLQIGDSYWAANISKVSNQTSPQICSSYQFQTTIYLLLSTGEIARYFNEKIIGIQLLAQMQDSQRLAPNSDQLFYLHPYFFIAKTNYSLFRVYSSLHSKLQLVSQISLPHQNQTRDRYYAFFKEKYSYRLLYSTEKQSYVFELLLPPGEELIQGFGMYFKVIGVVCVVVFLIYFKISGNKKEEISRGLDVRRKSNAQKSTMKVQNNEIEQFLKFKDSKQGTASKKKHA